MRHLDLTEILHFIVFLLVFVQSTVNQNTELEDAACKTKNVEFLSNNFVIFGD